MYADVLDKDYIEKHRRMSLSATLPSQTGVMFEG